MSTSTLRLPAAPASPPPASLAPYIIQGSPPPHRRKAPEALPAEIPDGGPDASPMPPRCLPDETPRFPDASPHPPGMPRPPARTPHPTPDGVHDGVVGALDHPRAPRGRASARAFHHPLISEMSWCRSPCRARGERRRLVREGSS
jgi:hypothetical protein